jgi:hypothetical protein
VALTDDLVGLVERQTAQHGVLLDRAVNTLRAPLSAFQGWYDHSAITRLCVTLAGLLGGFEAVSARSADSYMAEAVSISTGKRYRPTGSHRTQLGRIGMDNASILGRIANSYRFQQGALDRTLAQAMRSVTPLADWTEPGAAAMDRMTKIVQTNLQMAQRSQMLTTMGGSDAVTGYRRIIHPELATLGTCGLCIAASDRLYGKKVLLPIHPGCHCTVLPVTGKNDPNEINEIDFKQLYGDAAQFGKGTSAEALRQTRYRIDEHGEIGPVIRPESEPIRTEREAEKARQRIAVPAKPKTEDERVATLMNRRDQLAQEYRRIRNMIDNGDESEDDWGPTLDRTLDRIENLDNQINALREGPRSVPRIDRIDLDRPSAPDAPKGPQLADMSTMKPDDHDVRSDVIEANPNFEVGSAFAVNCVHCVQAFELRRRGYDVVATPLPDEMIRQQGRSAQAALTGAWSQSRRFTDLPATNLNEFAASWGPNARGWVVVSWKTGGSHIFAVENSDTGMPSFIDPQRGIKLFSGDYTKRAMPMVRAVRVDDLEPDPSSVMAFVRAPNSQEMTVNRRRVADRSYAGHGSPGQLRAPETISG